MVQNESHEYPWLFTLVAVRVIVAGPATTGRFVTTPVELPGYVAPKVAGALSTVTVIHEDTAGIEMQVAETI
jgi:hypothetical protein